MTDDDAPIFRAIADPTRRQILDVLREHGPMRAGDIATRFPTMTRIGVSKHLTRLRESNLVELADSSDGRERLYRLNAAPLREILAWLERYETFWKAHLDILKGLVEDES